MDQQKKKKMISRESIKRTCTLYVQVQVHSTKEMKNGFANIHLVFAGATKRAHVLYTYILIL